MWQTEPRTLCRLLTRCGCKPVFAVTLTVTLTWSRSAAGPGPLKAEPPRLLGCIGRLQCCPPGFGQPVQWTAALFNKVSRVTLWKAVGFWQPGAVVTSMTKAEQCVCYVSVLPVWLWLVVRSSRLLRKRPWQAFRVAKLILRLEVSTCTHEHHWAVHTVTGGDDGQQMPRTAQHAMCSTHLVATTAAAAVTTGVTL